MVVEVVLDGERLHELHRRLRADLGHAVEEEDVLLRVLRVVEVVGVELQEDRERKEMLSRCYCYRVKLNQGHD